MGLIGRVLSFIHTSRNGAQVSDTKLDPGGGPNITAAHFAPPGDDSYPLTTDYVCTTPLPQNGRQAAVGYVDPLNTPQTQPGEKRIYARDAAGAVIVDIWLKTTGEAAMANAAGSVTLRADGSILGQNAAGSFELQVGGNFVVNGVIIAPDGSITAPAAISAPSMMANGKELAAHTHSQANDSGGNTEQDTGPNN